MSTYTFSALANNQSVNFNAALDTLNFDIPNLHAASGEFAQNGADLWITYAGKTIKLAGTTLDQVSSAHFTFADGSKLLVGDDSPDDTSDKLSNTLDSKDGLIPFGHADYLDGRGGTDIMSGGYGDDVYVVDDLSDFIQEELKGMGTDTVQSYAANYFLPSGYSAQVENLRLMGTGNLNGSGNTLDNLIFPNAGNNVLSGGAGNDTVSYQYASAAVTASLAKATAQATGGSGSDTLRHFENLTGSAYNDALFGNVGNNLLDGGAGTDTLSGGGGNDTYVVNAALDKVVETGTSPTEIDTVRSSAATYTLPANVENLELMGSGNLKGIGNGLDNLIIANPGNNTVDGGSGNDTLSYKDAESGIALSLAVTTAQATGGSGTDTVSHFENLEGSAYADKLTGNAQDNLLTGNGGADTLKGGAGNDRLVVGDLSFISIDGGDGFDTLVLDANAQNSYGYGASSHSPLNLDLTATGNALSGLEAIDLEGNSALFLTAATLKNLSATSDTLVVDGGSANTLTGGGGWTPGADATADGHTYHTYTQAGATLWVNAEIGTNNVNGTLGPVVKASSLKGSAGFKLDGAAEYDHTGLSVSGAGDVNGDGFGDLLVGTGGEGSPTGYLVLGKSGGFTSPLALSTLKGSNGLSFADSAAYDPSALSVSAAGDVNGDGFADFIVGEAQATPLARDYAGSSFVVFGKASGLPAALDLAKLDGSDGFRMDGAAGQHAGAAVSSAGDINGDGYDDLIVSGIDDVYSGHRVDHYVVFGKASGFAPGLDLSALNGRDGFHIGHSFSSAYSEYGVSSVTASAAGDINGDGFADLVISGGRASYGYYDQRLVAYVVFGKASGFAADLDTATLDGSNGFRVVGQKVNEYSSASLHAGQGGDINGDGYDDIVLSSDNAASVILGKATGFAAKVDTTALDGSEGFAIKGLIDGAYSHIAATSIAGDMNGDGYADILANVGHYTYDGSGTGHTTEDNYVIFGQATGFGASYQPALNGIDGFRLEGAGRVSSTAGDVNGDGYADLIAGNPEAAPGGKTAAGASYVMFGGNFVNAVNKPGTTGTDSLAGTAAADHIVGGQGNDTLAGGGGQDVIYGGQGDDLIKVADLSFQKVDGGSGTDTLALTGAGLKLDLADFRNQLAGIEKIDLTGSGDNTLSFLKRDMLNLSDTRNTLQVDGNAGDHYHFADSGWTKGADVTLVGVTYHAYANGAAHVLLDAALTAA